MQVSESETEDYMAKLTRKSYKSNDLGIKCIKGVPFSWLRSSEEKRRRHETIVIS